MSKPLPGQSHPLGATITPSGVNFCVYSKYATSMELLLFDLPDDVRPSRVIPLDPTVHRTGDYWHVLLPGISPGQLYGYHAHGPYDPASGHRFDGAKVLLDPYARAVAGMRTYQREAAKRIGETNYAHSLKAVVVDPTRYDWEGDQTIRRPGEKSVVYELHTRGFTRHPNSDIGEHLRGTYAGLILKIPYLKRLGITAVELLPVQHYDEQDAPPGRRNYWGYSPLAFFAPHAGYSSRQDPLGPVDEFRDMVKALHKAGIAVILDVVFNHTAEAGGDGPTVCFRGFGNGTYYMLEADRSRYANYSGCGNVVNANNSVVRRMIRDCLRYWVQEMHVDGFRFDLASILTRDEEGHPMVNPPIVWTIDTDPVLANTKIIAEAWDAGGLYQVGHFAGDRFREWNGPFRDDIRRFLKGDAGMVNTVARRLMGSPDLFDSARRSVNFVTAHDGFTLNDLVSYSHKHNLANGEQNRDGTDANYSWNHGVEGPTTDPEVERLRRRQIRNFFVLNLVSQGTPMLLMGDEVRRTQFGNNNGYCQDNETSWFNWEDVERNRDLLRFVRGLITFVRRYEAFHYSNGKVPYHFHGTALDHPDWSEKARHLSFTLRDPSGERFFHVIANAFWEPQEFALSDDRGWLRIVDTSLASPQDFVNEREAPLLEHPTYRVEARTCVLLMSR